MALKPIDLNKHILRLSMFENNIIAQDNSELKKQIVEKIKEKLKGKSDKSEDTEIDHNSLAVVNSEEPKVAKGVIAVEIGELTPDFKVNSDNLVEVMDTVEQLHVNKDSVGNFSGDEKVDDTEDSASENTEDTSESSVIDLFSRTIDMVTLLLNATPPKIKKSSVSEKYQIRAYAEEYLFVANCLVAEEFGTKKELEQYLSDHPDADKSKHHVKEKPKGEPSKDNNSDVDDEIKDEIDDNLENNDSDDNSDNTDSDDNTDNTDNSDSDSDSGANSDDDNGNGWFDSKSPLDTSNDKQMTERGFSKQKAELNNDTVLVDVTTGKEYKFSELPDNVKKELSSINEGDGIWHTPVSNADSSADGFSDKNENDETKNENNEENSDTKEKTETPKKFTEHVSEANDSFKNNPEKAKEVVNKLLSSDSTAQQAINVIFSIDSKHGDEIIDNLDEKQAENLNKALESADEKELDKLKHTHLEEFNNLTKPEDVKKVEVKEEQPKEQPKEQQPKEQPKKVKSMPVNKKMISFLSRMGTQREDLSIATDKFRNLEKKEQEQVYGEVFGGKEVDLTKAISAFVEWSDKKAASVKVSSFVDGMVENYLDIISSRVASFYLESVVKDKDLMSDTGGKTKGRERSPDFKPPRTDCSKRFRVKRKTKDQIDKDVDKDKDLS